MDVEKRKLFLLTTSTACTTVSVKDAWLAAAREQSTDEVYVRGIAEVNLHATVNA